MVSPRLSAKLFTAEPQRSQSFCFSFLLFAETPKSKNTHLHSKADTFNLAESLNRAALILIERRSRVL
jgi:hypothetical protein